ncbi:hypothetical protein [Pseudomonas sp. OA65]|uniref:hypothetical protein n=1 Tax=Pseudomonas sp. OA65 TaxID=2818431 RepID=UPI001A9FBCB8|nr:hypothetical protein [Pseudomonas sp. OA65]MBO1539302.1 hypothetical protein [Pseudomonas sp. OA65]
MNDHYSVLVNAGIVVVLSQDMAEQETRDVLQSLLFAQLVANKKYPGYALAPKWYDEYREVLKNAWLQKTVTWNNFSVDGTCYLNAAHWLGRCLGESVDRTTTDNVTVLLNRVAKLPGTLPAMEQLRGHTYKRRDSALPHVNDESTGRVNLQVVLAQPGPLLSSAYLSYETSQTDLSNPLEQCLSVANVVGNVQSRCFQAGLSNELYEPLRGAIVQKLGDRPAEHIFDISSSVEFDPSGATP